MIALVIIMLFGSAISLLFLCLWFDGPTNAYYIACTDRAKSLRYHTPVQITGGVYRDMTGVIDDERFGGGYYVKITDTDNFLGYRKERIPIKYLRSIDDLDAIEEGRPKEDGEQTFVDADKLEREKSNG